MTTAHEAEIRGLLKAAEIAEHQLKGSSSDAWYLGRAKAASDIRAYAESLKEHPAVPEVAEKELLSNMDWISYFAARVRPDQAKVWYERCREIQRLALIGIRALALPQPAVPEGWSAIADAPMFVNGEDALVGQYVVGCGWKKVTIWEREWTRDDIIRRGGTHWWPHLRDLPLPTEKKP